MATKCPREINDALWRLRNIRRRMPAKTRNHPVYSRIIGANYPQPTRWSQQRLIQSFGMLRALVS